MIKARILVASLAFTCAVWAYAQNGPGGAPPSGGAPPAGAQGAGGADGSMPGSQTPDEELKSLTTKLNLSKSQRASALAILKDKQKAILDVREKYPVAKPGSNPSQDGIAAMTKAMTTSHNKTLAILNDEQKKKYDTIDTIMPADAKK